MTTHNEAANGHLEAAAQAAMTYQDIYAGPIAQRRPERLAALSSSVRTGLKLAEVHALLALGEAVRELRPLDVLEPLDLERVALATVDPIRPNDPLQAAQQTPKGGAE